LLSLPERRHFLKTIEESTRNEKYVKSPHMNFLSCGSDLEISWFRCRKESSVSAMRVAKVVALV
jgi:hypothetical protein